MYRDWDMGLYHYYAFATHSDPLALRPGVQFLKRTRLSQASYDLPISI